jgi:hypothetical protein
MNSTQQLNQTAPHLSQEAVKALLASAGWARVLGILGIIAAASLIVTVISSGGLKYSDSIAIFSLVVGVFVLLPSIFLFRFAGKAKAAAVNGRTDQFDEAFNSLKGFLIICCVVGVILILSFVFLSNLRWAES